jgi:hypothetical protein
MLSSVNYMDRFGNAWRGFCLCVRFQADKSIFPFILSFVHAHRDEIEGKNFKDLKWSANVEK